MKPVYKCEYCKFMGTEEEVKEHETTCVDNYDRQSCHTCANKRTNIVNGNVVYNCTSGIDIPEGKFFEFCGSHIRKEKSSDILSGIFGDIFK